MSKYSYAERVVKKVRKLITIQPYSECLKFTPHISINGHNFELNEIVFDNWEIIILVNKSGVFYKPYNSGSGQYNTIITYNGFDELLKMN